MANKPLIRPYNFGGVGSTINPSTGSTPLRLNGVLPWQKIWRRSYPLPLHLGRMFLMWMTSFFFLRVMRKNGFLGGGFILQFSPLLGEMIQCDYRIFLQKGWNLQLGLLYVAKQQDTFQYRASCTPLKINMEPKSEGLEDDFPFQTGDFQVPC